MNLIARQGNTPRDADVVIGIEGNHIDGTDMIDETVKCFI